MAPAMEDSTLAAARQSPEPPSSVDGSRNNWALALLLIPFVALLYPPFYTSIVPTLWGIPFFLWYQFLWVILGSAVTIVVYLLRRG